MIRVKDSDGIRDLDHEEAARLTATANILNPYPTDRPLPDTDPEWWRHYCRESRCAWWHRGVVMVAPGEWRQ